jgi:hypothetical protein
MDNGEWFYNCRVLDRDVAKWVELVFVDCNTLGIAAAC